MEWTLNLQSRPDSFGCANSLTLPLMFDTSPIAIDVCQLTRVYRVFQKREGLAASLKSLFRREYKTVTAVAGVSFRIWQGEMVAFLGPNGAGKTTTLKLLSGLVYPTSGDATVLGFTPWQREHAYRQRFSLVMGQKNQLWWDLPAQESFRLHQAIYRIEPREFQRRLDELTDLLEVRKLTGQPVRELSLGERMRMELIAALLHSPDLLLLDEPTIGLDVVSQRKVQEFLKHYQRERQITVLLTSHYMKDVEALCDRAIIINQGLIRHDGPLSSIIGKFSDHKIIELHFAGEVPSAEELQRFGTVFDVKSPRLKLRVPRAAVAQTLSALLSRYEIEDVSVQDRPLEEVIAELFQQDSATMRES